MKLKVARREAIKIESLRINYLYNYTMAIACAVQSNYGGLLTVNYTTNEISYTEHISILLELVN